MLVDRDFVAYHDKIYDEDIANDNSESNSENDEQSTKCQMTTH